MGFQFSKSSKDRMGGVHPDLISTFNEAIKYSPVDFGVPEFGGKRTQGEQYQLFLKGLSKCDGTKNKSKHQSGMALDFYAYVGKATWDKNCLSIVAGAIMTNHAKLKKEGKVSKDYDLVWGGTFGSDNFNGWDMPHFELIEL